MKDVKKQKLKIEVEVWGIEVEETQKYENGHGSGWYKFEYSIRINGGNTSFILRGDSESHNCNVTSPNSSARKEIWSGRWKLV